MREFWKVTHCMTCLSSLIILGLPLLISDNIMGDDEGITLLSDLEIYKYVGSGCDPDTCTTLTVYIEDCDNYPNDPCDLAYNLLEDTCCDVPGSVNCTGIEGSPAFGAVYDLVHTAPTCLNPDYILCCKSELDSSKQHLLYRNYPMCEISEFLYYTDPITPMYCP